MSRSSVLLALLVACALDVSVAAQGLGDAARRERGRRSSATSAKAPKVYTNDALAAAEVGGSVPPAANPAPNADRSRPAFPSAPSKPATVARTAVVLDEAHWRERITQARTAVDLAAAVERRLREAWEEQGRRTFGSEAAVMLPAPGCVPCPGSQGDGAWCQDSHNGLGGGPCPIIPVYDAELYAKRVEAVRASAAAKDEFILLYEEARRAGVPLEWFH